MLGPLREDAPRRIGPYELLARLGAGGMGEVFLGRDTREGAEAGTFVALKTVRRDVAGEPAFRDRFRREIKVAGLVSSRWAAAPVGGDADAEVPWLATAYVPGPSLSQAVRRGGPLPVGPVRALGAGVARALGDLHRGGVLHRDLKPGNVMLSADGPRLIDFGIARSNAATTMTATGMMVGTPAFMSPEHVAGARRVVAASDVFCLGSLLCYAATGEDPFGDGPLAAVLYRVSQAEADLGRVPAELRDVVAACLAADPDERPSPDRLAELLGGTPPDGRAFPWPEGVRNHIGEYGSELARLVASGGPLVETAGGTGAGGAGAGAPGAGAGGSAAGATAGAGGAGAVGVHAAPTLPPVAPPAVPGAPAAPGAPARKRRWGPLAGLVALAVPAAGVGVYLLWPQDGPSVRTPPAAAPKAAPRVPGVDPWGLADSSGVVPQNTAQRPAGWKPWRAELSGPAHGCSAGERVLVCRLTNGRYEALDPADGKRLWEAEVDVEGPAESYRSPQAFFFTARDSTRPTVHGDSVVLVSGQRLQVRDARTGAVRWEKPALGPQDAWDTRPLVGDGVVFAATEVTADVSSDQVALTAFALADGRELWSERLSNADISQAATRAFEPVAYADGVVYALSQGGLVAYDGKKGTLLGQAPPEAGVCRTVKVFGGSAYCSGRELRRDSVPTLHLLDARTLAPRASAPAPLRAVEPAAVGPGAMVASTGREVRILDPRSGESLAAHPVAAAPAGLAQALSAPLLAGDQVVYADFGALYAVRLGADRRPGELRVVRVPGAPGPRAPEPNDDPEQGWWSRRTCGPRTCCRWAASPISSTTRGPWSPWHSPASSPTPWRGPFPCWKPCPPARRRGSSAPTGCSPGWARAAWARCISPAGRTRRRPSRTGWSR